MLKAWAGPGRFLPWVCWLITLNAGRQGSSPGPRPFLIFFYFLSSLCSLQSCILNPAFYITTETTKGLLCVGLPLLTHRCCLPAARVQLFATLRTVAPPGSSVHGILQRKIVEWVVISSFRGSSQNKDWTCIFCIGWQILYHWATGKPLRMYVNIYKPRLGLPLMTRQYPQLP